jgi:hypothetical protein
MSQVCDKDKEFYGRKIATGSHTTSPRSKDQESFKPLRKHDKVRQQKDEYEKICRIERELHDSVELC